MPSDFRKTLIDKYYSTHYIHFTPQTAEGWAWVLERIRLNFDDILSRLPRDSRILDVACGVGYLEDYLLKQGFQNIESIDLSGEQVEIAKQILTEHGVSFMGKINFVVADAFDYLGKSDQLDLVAMFDFIEHFSKEEIGQLSRLAYAALRPGGLLLLRTINADNPLFGRFFYHDFTHETPFTPDSIRQCLAAVNFNLEKVNYEEMPFVKEPLIQRLKSKTRAKGLRTLAKFLGVRPQAFTENLVVVARK